MDPVGAFLIAVFVLFGGVRGWWASARARLTGDTEGLDARRAQERQRDHDLRKSAQEHRHAERMAGRGYPSFSESLGAGLGRRLANPRQYDELGPLGRWWWRRREEWAERDEQRRREQAERTARGEQPHQKAGKWAKQVAQWAWARAWQYWADSEPGRARQRRRDGIVDAEVVDDPPARPEAPRTDPAPPPPRADAPPPASGPGGPAPSGPRPEPPRRPGPVRATAQRIDDQPAHPAPASPPLALTRSDQGPAVALEAATDGGDVMSSALVPTSRALGRDARSSARHHPAAKMARKSVGEELARVVGGYSAAEVNDAVALMAAWAVAIRDCADELHRDLQNQRVRGEGMSHLQGAANDVSSAVTELHQAAGHFEYHERLLDDIAEIQQQSGLGNLTSYSGGQIH